jgi:putative copper resistance protein D
MSQTYFITVTVHVLAALVWLGGMLVFALIAPLLRAIPDDSLRAGLFDALGRRFRAVGWVCIVALLASGVGQLQMRGWWGFDVWGSREFLTTPLGISLVAKLALVFVMVAIQAIHDFWLGPKAGRALVGSLEARALRRRAAHLARANAFLGLVLVYVAVRLGRGG